MPYCFPQEWSKCVDAERETDNDFTETCREAVSIRCLLLCLPTATQVHVLLLWYFVVRVQDAKSLAVNCLQTIKLRECMLKNREYYAPLLEEEEREAREREQKVETNQEPGEGSESPHPNSPEGTEH